MAEVHDMNLGFEYSDLTEDFSSPLFPGLLLEPDLDDPWPEELPHVKVERIVVFDREYINKVNGSTGLSYIPWQLLLNPSWHVSGFPFSWNNRSTSDNTIAPAIK